MNTEFLEANPHRVSDPSFSNQSAPSVASLTDGGWVVVWQSHDQDGEDTGVYARIYSADGDAQGEEFQVNAFTNHWQGYPSVAPLHDGSWIVSWHSYGQDGDNYGVYAKRFSVDGSAQDTEFRINTYISEAQKNPSLAPLEDGGWLVTWFSRQDGSNASVHGQRYSQNGETVGTEFQINSYTESAQELPKAASLEDGGWIVTWVSHLQDGENGGIFGQRYSVTGEKIGSEFQVNTYTDGWQQDQAVTALTDGGWIVAWQSENPNGSGTVLFGQRYAADGKKHGGEFQVDIPLTGYHSAPEITSNDDGGWDIVWSFTSADNSTTTIFMQKYSADGTAQGDPLKISTGSAGENLTPVVAALEDGSWVVAWQGIDGIFSQLVSADDEIGVITNNPPIGTVTIVGTAAEDQTLTLISNIADEDGIGMVSGGFLNAPSDTRIWTISGVPIQIADVGKTYSADQFDGAGFERIAVGSDGSLNFLGVTEDTAFINGFNNFHYGGTDTFDGSKTHFEISPNALAYVTALGEVFLFDPNFAENQWGLSDNDLWISDSGVDAFNYQWQADGVDISGATADTLTLSQEQVGKEITVTVSYTDGGGTLENVTSPAASWVEDIGLGSTYTGSPLTGVIRGTISNDQYLGNVDGNPAIVDATITDPGGYDTVQAAGAATRFALINGSSFDFSESHLTFSSKVSGGYYGRAISNSEIITGSQGSNIELSSVEVDGVGFNWFTAAADGLTLVGDAGGDNVKISVVNVDEDAFGITSSDISLGAGNDYLEIDIDATLQSSAAVNKSKLTFGMGADTLAISSSQKGLVDAEVDLGDGDDIVEINASQHSLISSTIFLGDGSDKVVLGGAREFNYNLFESTIDLGAGNDELILFKAYNSYVAGGEGFDTLTVSRSATDFKISQTEVGYQVRSLNQDASVFSLEGIELIRFADAEVLLDGPGNKPPTGSVTISGTVAEDQTLTLSSTVADADGIDADSVSYQWYRDGSEIPSATDTSYTLTQDDVGAAITASQSYTDNSGNDHSVTSADTTAVLNVNDAPTGSVTISGTVAEDQTLTAVTDTLADEDGLGLLSYRWLRDGSKIDSETASSYTLTQEDVGSEISLTVSYTDGQGTGEIVSSATTSPVEAATPAVPAFNISLASEVNGTATFAVYANELVDPDSDGIGSFEFALTHDPSDLLIDADSIAAASGISNVPNYDPLTGIMENAAFAFPNFTDLSTPIVTFDATILDADNPIDLSITNAIVDRVDQDDVVETFNFSSVSITATTFDRFGDDLVLSNDEVVAYELTGGGQIYVREVGDSENNTLFEIVANPTSEFSALDFDLTDYAGLMDFTLSDALSTWTSQTNTTVPNQVAFSGFSNSGGIPAGQETVLATFTTSIDPDFDISGIELDGAAEPDVSVGEIPVASTNGNVTVFEVSRNSDTYVDAYKPIDEASEDAIGAYDALQALRLAVGLTKSDGTAEWHDYLAADINKDGRVGADDALDILKFAVGLTDGSSADWIFVDGDADWSGITRSNTSYDEGVILDDVLVDTSINMTGILVGDLDGSYVA